VNPLAPSASRTFVHVHTAMYLAMYREHPAQSIVEGARFSLGRCGLRREFALCERAVRCFVLTSAVNFIAEALCAAPRKWYATP
jgi:hypothetical protein